MRLGEKKPSELKGKPVLSAHSSQIPDLEWCTQIRPLDVSELRAQDNPPLGARRERGAPDGLVGACWLRKARTDAKERKKVLRCGHRIAVASAVIHPMGKQSIMSIVRLHSKRGVTGG